MIEKLKSMSFLGIEVKAGKFEFPEEGSEADRASALAARLNKSLDERRVRIHPAFHQFLEVENSV
jgi:hypothetical protein